MLEFSVISLTIYNSFFIRKLRELIKFQSWRKLDNYGNLQRELDDVIDWSFRKYDEKLKMFSRLKDLENLTWEGSQIAIEWDMGYVIDGSVHWNNQRTREESLWSLDLNESIKHLMGNHTSLNDNGLKCKEFGGEWTWALNLSLNSHIIWSDMLRMHKHISLCCAAKDKL